MNLSDNEYDTIIRRNSFFWFRQGWRCWSLYCCIGKQIKENIDDSASNEQSSVYVGSEIKNLLNLYKMKQKQ